MSMIVIPPVSIDDSSLTSSTVVEPFAPTDYAGGTNYGLTDFATDPTTKLVYRSLQSPNLGHAPASSPKYWKVVGYKEVAYNAGTPYSASTAAAPVYVLSNHRIYQALQASTGKDPYANPDYWQDIGPSLQYAMFDTLRHTATVGAAPLVVVITPGVRVSAVTAIDVDADAVRVVMTSGGATVYDKTTNLITRDVFNWYDYYFKDFSQIFDALFQNIPPYSNGIITVTFTKSGSSASCGALVVGTAHDLGRTQKNAANAVENFSTLDRDPFGNAVLIQKRSVPRTTQTTIADKALISDMLALRDDLNAVPAVWAALTDDSDDYFPPFLILGYYRQFTLTPLPPSKVTVTLELEGV